MAAIAKELAGLENFIAVRAKTARASSSSLGRPGPVEEGEFVTEQQQKAILLRNLETNTSPYSAGGDARADVEISSSTDTASVRGVLWDTVDEAHSEPFPDDVEATWQNATLFMVAVGLCKAIATSHEAATRRYPGVEMRMKAFWSTLFTGQIGSSDVFDATSAEKDEMAYMDWLPEANGTWTAGTPPLTLMTSGLIYLKHQTDDLQEAMASTNFKMSLHSDWLHGIDNEDGDRQANDDNDDEKSDARDSNSMD